MTAALPDDLKAVMDWRPDSTAYYEVIQQS